MTPLTLQEIFTKAATHLLTQGRRAMLPDGLGCAYRGVGGTRCAIGCLIRDEAYTPQIEERDVDSIARRFPEVLAKSGIVFTADPTSWCANEFVSDPVYGLLNALRRTHDHVEPQHWKERLIEIADDHGFPLSSVPQLVQ